MSIYKNKKGIVIKDGDKVRFLHDMSRGHLTPIKKNATATAEYHEATNREPFWVLNFGGEWNPMESHSDLVLLLESVILADSPESLSSVESDDLTDQIESYKDTIAKQHKDIIELTNVIEEYENRFGLLHHYEDTYVSPNLVSDDSDDDEDDLPDEEAPEKYYFEDPDYSDEDDDDRKRIDWDRGDY